LLGVETWALAKLIGRLFRVELSTRSRSCGRRRGNDAARSLRHLFVSHAADKTVIGRGGNLFSKCRIARTAKPSFGLFLLLEEDRPIQGADAIAS